MTATMNEPPAIADLSLDSIASWDDEGTSRAPRKRWTGRLIGTGEWGRRGILGSMVALGTAGGLAVLGVFPQARTVSAAACVRRLERYIAGPCPTNVGNCSPACGPSTVNLSACGSNWYHKYTGNYRNRPNSCNRVRSADGWYWGGKGCCRYPDCIRSYRCHDGCTRSGRAWKKTICRYTSPNCGC